MPRMRFDPCSAKAWVRRQLKVDPNPVHGPKCAYCARWLGRYSNLRIVRMTKAHHYYSIVDPENKCMIFSAGGNHAFVSWYNWGGAKTDVCGCHFIKGKLGWDHLGNGEQGCHAQAS